MGDYDEIEIEKAKKRKTGYAYELGEYSLLGIRENERNGGKERWK